MKKNYKRYIALGLLLVTLFTTAAPAQAAKYISKVKAKKIALKHAGKKSSKVKFKKAKCEREDDRMVYEVEFRLKKNRHWEFEYEIDARTGRIIDFDWDYDD